jgi:hypothetical protein
MTALVSVIVLVALIAGPAGAQTVYQNSDPTYPVFEVNAQTEKKPATTWAERTAEWVQTMAQSTTGKAVQVAVGLYNILVNKEAPVTEASITF